MMPRAQSESRPITRLHNYSAMPLEDLDAYRRDSGSSIQSQNSETVPKTPQDDSDSNATEAESNGKSSEEQIFDGQSDDSDQKSKRRCSLAATSADDDVVGPSDSESFLSERAELFGSKRYKRCSKRPRLQWELVSSNTPLLLVYHLPLSINRIVIFHICCSLK
jgi:hypothetical protein